MPHRLLLRILELLYVGVSGSGQLPRQKVLKRYSSHNRNKSKGSSNELFVATAAHERPGLASTRYANVLLYIHLEVDVRATATTNNWSSDIHGCKSNKNEHYANDNHIDMLFAHPAITNDGHFSLFQYSLVDSS